MAKWVSALFVACVISGGVWAQGRTDGPEGSEYKGFKEWDRTMTAFFEFGGRIDSTGDDKKQINPWEFSSDAALAPKVIPFRGQYVVIKYRQYMLNNPMKRDTDYELLEITAVDGASKPKTACENAAAAGKNSAGFRVARIVKASLKGNVNKSYELKVQMGGSGNEFYDMSVSDPAMYECALKWLKSGGKATIWYKQSFLFNPLTRNTGYDIVKIEPLPSLD